MNGNLDGAGQTQDRLRDLAQAGLGHVVLEAFQVRVGQGDGQIETVFVAWVKRFNVVIKSGTFSRVAAALADLEKQLRERREKERRT